MTGTKFLHCVQTLSGYDDWLDLLAFVRLALAWRYVPSDQRRSYLLGKIPISFTFDFVVCVCIFTILYFPKGVEGLAGNCG